MAIRTRDINDELLEKIEESELLSNILNIGNGTNKSEINHNEEYIDSFFYCDDAEEEELEQASNHEFIIPDMIRLYEEYLKTGTFSLEYDYESSILFTISETKIEVYKINYDNLDTYEEDIATYSLGENKIDMVNLMKDIKLMIDNYEEVFNDSKKNELVSFYKIVREMDKSYKEELLKNKTELEKKMIDLNITKEDFNEMIKLHNNEIGM